MKPLTRRSCSFRRIGGGGGGGGGEDREGNERGGGLIPVVQLVEKGVGVAFIPATPA